MERSFWGGSVIKKGRFAEFISDLRFSDKPKWKIWAALFYKSPWFFVTFIGNFLSLLGMIIDKHNSINLMFNSTISYMIPLAIWVWGITLYLSNGIKIAPANWPGNMRWRSGYMAGMKSASRLRSFTGTFLSIGYGLDIIFDQDSLD
jgi:hypothetical protein